jgi:hypothetical protein
LRAEKLAANVIVRHLEVYWPVTLMIARAADTLFFAPFFVGFFSLEWLKYVVVSAVGCLMLTARPTHHFSRRGIVARLLDLDKCTHE